MGFKEKMLDMVGQPLTAREIAALQVNLGYVCNMSCRHCHVEAGPNRGTWMNKKIMDAVLGAMIEYDINILDITGGAPELSPHFSYLVEEATKTSRRVIVRTNLTVFFEEGMGGLPEFYRDNKVELVASLPCYLETNVDGVRGKGAFQKSIKAIERLNSLGYGYPSGLKLNLVYNPAGASLPPSQESLDGDYRRELETRFGLIFTSLYTFANMPIGRFRDYLERTNELERYMELLKSAFNPETIPGLMCRRMISVGWDGRLHDCDFNQALGLTVHGEFPQSIGEFDYSLLSGRTIAIDNHCYGCTAGQGST